MSTVFVDIKQSRKRWPLARPQRWYWIALSGDNMRRLGRSSENYTNRQDCIDAVWLLFGDDQSNVYMRQAEKGNEILRLAPS